MDLKRILLFLLMAVRVPAAGLTLSSPLEFSVVQRGKHDVGTLIIAGSLEPATKVQLGTIEARIFDAAREGQWKTLTSSIQKGGFRASMSVPAGGWYRLELRVLEGGKTIAEATVAAVGVGDIFVVAGQSNSANHGEEKQTAKNGRVVSFDGTRWQPCVDPQPGASGNGGSFIPPFGDAISQQTGLPVGFVSCGIGATSVREWLPEGSKFSQPPTLTGRVRSLPGGEWESNGEAFGMLVSRMKQLGPQGFRAVLWHQGESDANQQDSTRTLPGPFYRQHMEQVIRESRHRIGWEAPWFVSQVSYHVPGDEASPEIRDAQASLWKDGVALAGPDSDALKGSLRENNGQGVHFSGPGLRELAARWYEKVEPWMARPETED